MVQVLLTLQVNIHMPTDTHPAFFLSQPSDKMEMGAIQVLMQTLQSLIIPLSIIVYAMLSKHVNITGQWDIRAFLQDV